MPKAGLQFQKKDEYMTPKEVVDFSGRLITTLPLPRNRPNI